MPAGLRWLFVGQGPMGAAALDVLAARRAPVGVLTAEPVPGSGPVAGLAAARGLAVEQTGRVGPAPQARWPALFAGLDVAVCCCWHERIPAPALRQPAHGWLNLHPSTLPAWRGADPVAWQLLAAARRIGCSVHRMTEQQDAGPVVAGGAVGVEPDDDRGAAVRRSAARLGELAADVLDDLAAGVALREHAQRAEDVTLCPPAGTVPLVDPRLLRADEGARVARAFSPQPGIAVATLAPERRFAFVGLGRERATDEAPGAVAALDAHNVAIAFRDRWVRGRAWAAGGWRADEADA